MDGRVSGGCADGTRRRDRRRASVVSREAKKIWAPRVGGAHLRRVRAYRRARAYPNVASSPQNASSSSSSWNVPISRLEGRRRPSDARADTRRARRFESRASRFVEAREKRRLRLTKKLTVRVALRARCRAAVAMRALATGPVGRVAVPGAKPPPAPGRCTRGVPVRPRRNVTVTFSSSGDAPRERSRIRASSSSPFPDPLGLNDPIEARFPKTAPRGLSPDLAPVLPEDRTWSSLDFLGLWIGLVVCVPAWRFAASFAALGATAAQAFSCVFLANAIVLVPMVASAQIGTKYGAPFPVIARAAFGKKGSRVPVLARALVGCGWFGIQTHVGGLAVKALLVAAIGLAFGEHQTAMAVWDPPWETFGVTSRTTPRLAAYVCGASPLEVFCYVVFLFAQLFVVRKGVESIKTAERVAAPFLCALTLAMFLWAWQTGGGTFAGMFSLQKASVAAAAASDAFASTHFFPALSAVVGFWATMALNISDFSRFAKTQKDQATGQALGLAGFMTVFSVVAVAVTTVASGVPTIVGFGPVPLIDVGDPTALLGSAAFGPLARLVAALGLIAATLSTNVAANVVAPANAFVALSRTGAAIGDDERGDDEKKKKKKKRRDVFRVGGAVRGAVGHRRRAVAFAQRRARVRVGVARRPRRAPGARRGCAPRGLLPGAETAIGPGRPVRRDRARDAPTRRDGVE